MLKNLFLILIYSSFTSSSPSPSIIHSIDQIESTIQSNVCAVRPSECNLLCPFGYTRNSTKQCVCSCAPDPCQLKICKLTESCIAIGVKARCIPKFNLSNRDECPRLTGGVCALRCEKDSDCSGRLICCSNGCGRECTFPIARSFPITTSDERPLPIRPVSNSLPGSFQRLINAVTNMASTHLKSSTTQRPSINIFASQPIRPEVIQNVKVGQCPVFNGNFSTCKTQKQCSNDVECNNVDKCCPNECGATCVEPIKATGCIHMIIAISKLPERRLLNEFVPFCERNGRFSSIQCDIEFCWCVDVHYGNELIGTRINRNQRRIEMCQERRLCSQKCQNHCSHGHLMDSFGCPLPTCQCVDICKNVKCQNDWETCQLIEPDCANPPCLPVPRCLLNPCRNGSPIRLSSGITALCSSDDNCLQSTCFKIGYNGLGFCCAGADLSSKDGRCPSKPVKCDLLHPNSIQPTCHSDSECPNDEKCCFNGCTLSCAQPEKSLLKKSEKVEKEKPHSALIYQPGDVEKYNKAHLSSLVADCKDLSIINDTCLNECHSDFQCNGMKRCCRQGCSTTCMFPARSTPCFHLALTAELYSLRSAMKCDRAGNYEQYQCDEEGCFCVDITTGEQIPGSRVIGKKPNCEVKNPCQPLVCKSACPFGFDIDEKSCPTCKCKNPCENIKCPQGSVCVMSSVECYQRGNCPQQPRCVLNFCPIGDPFISAIGNVESCSKDGECPSSTHWCHLIGLSSDGICCPTPTRSRHPGVCPIVPISLDATICKISCKVDDDCKSHQKCCFDGCGTSCKDISTPLVEFSKDNFEKAGICISEQRVLCNRLEKNTCEFDSDCAGVAKCCDDGCVKSCAYPLQTSKCLVRKTNLQKMGQMDLIKCRPDGSFEPIQCDVEFCWCVDEDGNYIDGTRTSEDDVPKCPEPCPLLECERTKCEYGWKKDSKQCPTCECVDPCEGVTCPSDSICVPTSVPCVTKPCPTIPRCVINPCPNSEIVRNSTTLQAKRCASFKDCYDPSMTTHCSMITMDNGFCCTAEEPEVQHAGYCPRITDLIAAKVEKCVQECKSDRDCDDASKCCWNGCGLTCVTTIPSIRPPSYHQTVSNAHFGDCLKVAPLGAFCLQRPTIADCKNDMDCPAYYKCCSDGCVMRCSQPHRAPLCVHQRVAALALRNDYRGTESNEEDSTVFVPECDASGNFDEIQAHFGLMWCVNELGVEIPGTKSLKVPDCDHPKQCPVRECVRQCSMGFKTDNDGCPVCDCISPCEFVNCPAGNICRLIPVECTTSECLPIAKCIPNMCSSGEPFAPKNGLLSICDKASPCPAGFYCQNSGFGDVSFCCAAPRPPPSPPTQNTLGCSPIPHLLASVDGSSCVVGCRRPSDCQSSTCCYNGCGTSCQFETKKRPIKPAVSKRPILSSLKIERKASKLQNVVENHLSAITPIFSNFYSTKTTTPPENSAVIKLGTCPSYLINPGCSEQCRSDSDCHGFFKCCDASCGKLCSAPRISTACIHRLVAFESKPIVDDSHFPPPVQCTTAGLFRKYQCDARTSQCWCVDVASGVEEIGTRFFNLDLSSPDCSAPKLCSVQCATLHCPYGVKLDMNGCPLNGACECNNICASLNCPTTMECALKKVECTFHPCPDVPICVDVNCPIPQKDVYRNVILCENDGGCGKNAKCVFSDQNLLGVCCFQKVAQSTVLNLVAPAIITTSTSSSLPIIIEAKSISSSLSSNQAISMIQSTNCTTLRRAFEDLLRIGAILNAPMPRCSSSSGNFQPTQCNDKRCWCVNEISGEEVHGTRKKKTKNACKTQSMCLSQCSSSLCPYGLLLDSIGCPRSECICKSACENIDCPNGQVCILRKSDCADRWCLPIPTCEKSPCNNGLKPLVETRTRQQFSCNAHQSICPVGYYCTAFDTNMQGVCCPGNESIKSIGTNVGLTCPHGDPFSSLADGTPLPCAVMTNGCPSTHYCSTIAGRSTGICCVSKRHVCNLQKDAGPCSARVSRYFYSSISHTCSIFHYGGCAGNLNNFATLADCENFCAGIGLDLSAPFDHAISHRPPLESYQIAFTLTGPKIETSRKLDAERQLINLLVEKFRIPRGSIDDLMIRNDNHVKFTIRDVEARQFARQVSEQVSNGELTMKLGEKKFKAEPQTLTALHISENSKNTTQIIIYAIILASSIFIMCVVCVFCFSCFCYYRNHPKPRSTTPSSSQMQQNHRRGAGVERVFSRDDISICSDFNRPQMIETRHSLSRSTNRRRAASWLSLG